VMVAPGHFSAVRPASTPDPGVLRQMAENAIDYLKLVRGVCRACECGQPCPECVLDGERLRSYQAVLDGLGAA
jgi:hypothetical protein